MTRSGVYPSQQMCGLQNLAGEFWELSTHLKFDKIENTGLDINLVLGKPYM